MKEYEDFGHKGWEGAAGASGFAASWGSIGLEEICDCSDLPSLSAASSRALLGGFEYLYVSKPSKYGSNLYRKWSDKQFVCVNAYVKHRKNQAAINLVRYHGDSDFRFRHLVRVARVRADKLGIPFDLREDVIVERILRGKCEATGLDLELAPSGAANLRNPYAPSLDQRVPRLGYTEDNVQVVCLGWNLLKSNFETGLFEKFVGDLAVSSAVGVEGI